MTDKIDQRSAERGAFLRVAGWQDAKASPLAGDASTRSYERLDLAGRSALLMNAPPKAETAPCPPGADPQTRQALGYNAMARLAGPNLHAFLAVSSALRGAGLSAPDIYAADPESGFALIEDFGDDLFARAVPAGADETLLYATAIDALLALRAAAPPPPAFPQYTMLSYDGTALDAEAALLTQWYWPHRTGSAAPSPIEAEHAAAWAQALGALSAPAVIVLRDFHAENLLWLPARSGHRRVGVIDFQDGLMGHAAYDLASLLEDARRDVDPHLAQAMLARYTAGARAVGDFDEAAFFADYAILAAQRNAKILGIFARLVHRDGKRRYLDFLPRVEALFRKDLERPALVPVRAFFRRRLPDLLS